MTQYGAAGEVKSFWPNGQIFRIVDATGKVWNAGVIRGDDYLDDAYAINENLNFTESNVPETDDSVGKLSIAFGNHVALIELAEVSRG